MLLGEEGVVLSKTSSLPPTLFLEMAGFKAFFGVATIHVEMLLEVCMIGISEITLPIGMTPNYTDPVLLT